MSDDRKGKNRAVRASDIPGDLIHEREVFVRTFLKKGVEFAEELLQENNELRRELSDVLEENARLRAQVASDDAIRDLLRTIDRLEQDKRHLLRQSSELERTRREHEGRYEEIERELNDLANLYIASFQLHTSLSVRRVVRHLCDMLGQLIGARSFIIYIVDPDAKTASVLAHEGVGDRDLGAVTLGEGKIGDVCMTGMPLIREDSALVEGSLDNPLAVVPLMVEDRPVGAIAVLALLEQKDGWASVDREMFKLIGAHGGTSLVAAMLYQKSGSGSASSALAGLRNSL